MSALGSFSLAEKTTSSTFKTGDTAREAAVVLEPDIQELEFEDEGVRASRRANWSPRHEAWVRYGDSTSRQRSRDSIWLRAERLTAESARANRLEKNDWTLDEPLEPCNNS